MHNTSGTTRTPIAELLKGATAGKSGKVQQFHRPGGFDAANKAFDDAMGTIPIKDHGDGIRSGMLGDGTTISVRPKSSEGSATIQINPPSGKPIKIRFG